METRTESCAPAAGGRPHSAFSYARFDRVLEPQAWEGPGAPDVAAALADADAALARGGLDQAEAILEGAVRAAEAEGVTGMVPALVALAEVAFKHRGQAARAEALLERALGADPRAVPALRLRGALHAAGRRAAEGLRDLRAALAAEPGDPDTLCDLGCALSAGADGADAAGGGGDGPSAAMYFAQALATDPAHVRTLYNLGASRHAAHARPLRTLARHASATADAPPQACPAPLAAGTPAHRGARP
jgi:tetratricopeptide (TPR) repeat protein